MCSTLSIFPWIWMENYCIILVIIRRSIASFSPYHSFNENVLNSKLITCIPPIRTFVLKCLWTYWWKYIASSKLVLGLVFFSLKLQIKNCLPSQTICNATFNWFFFISNSMMFPLPWFHALISWNYFVIQFLKSK